MSLTARFSIRPDRVPFHGCHPAFDKVSRVKGVDISRPRLASGRIAIHR